MSLQPATYAKAIIGSVLAGLGTAQVAWQSDHFIDVGEWMGVAISVLTVFAGVFGLPNKATSTSTAVVGVEVTAADAPKGRL